MFKRIWILFLRDLKVNSREFLTLYILVVPILLGIAINLLAPSINDTTVEIALIEGEDTQMASYLEEFAKVEQFENYEALEKRINERDNIVGITEVDGQTVVLAQGNEPESVTEFAKLIKTFYELDVDIEETSTTLHDFGKEKPPFKAMFVNLALLLTSVLAGMIISVNIIEDKGDNTISAIHLTPTSRATYILGKSMVGIFISVYGCIAILLLTGYGGVNLGQAILAILSVTVLSLLIGFIEGINNDDVMNAAAGVKMVFLPVAAAVAAVELLSDKWQMLFYWIPFYWSYKANVEILNETATWPQILLYVGLVLGLSSVVVVILAPKIRKGLE